MRRPASLATVAADLARIDRPGWVRASTWQRTAALREALRYDLLRAIHEEGQTAAAAHAGVSRRTLVRWLAAGGWLESDGG